jgi:hypothetical protein
MSMRHNVMVLHYKLDKIIDFIPFRIYKVVAV